MRAPDLEIDLLRAFVAVAETGSFTAAAAVVGRSQSAVSQKIIRLEESLTRRLFDRTSRSLTLTRDGEHLLEIARRILEINDVSVREMLEPPAIGSLRLGIAEDFVPQQLPKLLTRFRRLYPDLHLELTTGLTRDLLDAFDAGQVDLVIAIKEGGAQRGRVIWREPLVWMAAAEYQPDFVQPAQLVLLRPPCSYRDLTLRTLDDVRQRWVAACTASSLMGVQAAVAGGLGMTVLGRSFLQQGLHILRTPVHWPALPMNEIVVVGEETAEPTLVRPLIAFLAESLSHA
jgi:DNA-binding transcriptional LysR family regulator